MNARVFPPTWTSSCSSLLTSSSPPMSSQLTWGTSATVSLRADGLLWLRAHWWVMLWWEMLYVHLFIPKDLQYWCVPHAHVTFSSLAQFVSFTRVRVFVPGSRPWWRPLSWAGQRRWFHPPDLWGSSSCGWLAEQLLSTKQPGQHPHGRGSLWQSDIC